MRRSRVRRHTVANKALLTRLNRLEEQAELAGGMPRLWVVLADTPITHAESGGQEWDIRPGESEDEFRARVNAEAPSPMVEAFPRDWLAEHRTRR